MLDDVVRHLDGILENEEWEGIDGSTNGLQVENSGEIENVGFAVDASAQTVRLAAENGLDMLVTHHGFFWGGKHHLVGQDYHRIRLLIENDIALYSSHLPLDAHERVGNNVRLLRELDATTTETFGEIGGKEVGYVGRVTPPVEFEEFIREVGDAVGREPDTVGFGNDRVRDVAVLTGAGGGHVPDAAEAGADVYITGEPKHRAHHDAREYGINVVFGGHYHTETFGVRALKEDIEQSPLDVGTYFIDVPTEV